MEKFLSKPSTSGSNDDTGPDVISHSSSLVDSSQHTDANNGTIQIAYPAQTNKRKKGSKVWSFFKKSLDNKFAKCLKCGKEYKTSGNTTNLNDHRYHASLFVNDSDEHSSSTIVSASTSSSTRSSSIRSISPFFKREVHYDNNSQRKKELDRALTGMVSTDFQPFNIVNDEGFRFFVNLLNPRYVIPSKHTIKEIMKKMYSESMKMLKDILNNVMYVAVTTDSWSSIASESYLTVTCHFITKDFELKSVVLSTKPIECGVHHTAENIASTLMNVFIEWNIEKKISCIVTDNASNMIKACEILKKKHLPCFAHTINLAIQENIEIASVKQLLVRCKDVVKFIKSSNIASELFRREQNTDTPYKLIQEVSTRWNSAYHMISRIIKTHDALNRTLLKVKKAPPLFAAEEIVSLKEVEQIVACFEEATLQISGSKYVTISLPIPISFGIFNNLMYKIKPELTTDEGKQLCDGLVESVKVRLFHYEKRTVCQMGTLIDPRFKQEGFINSENAKSAAQFLEQEMIFLLKKENETKSSSGITTESLIDMGEGSSSSQESGSTSTLFSFLEDINRQKVKSKTADAIITKRQYMERPNAPQHTDPLLFWKVNGRDLHPLDECSQKYLCVPASSVESERTFSVAGLITQRRSRLKAKNVDMLTFLNRNQWLIN